MFRPRFIGLLLALVTLLVYLPVARDGFVVVYDDDSYVTENRAVQNGLTWAGVQWAFTTGHASNWHPLTWLSHMTDCELFGLNAGAHHSVNALFHAANALLLLLLLLRLTGELWPAAFVAALFAWHPLHVESVAWIAERKDVLSTFFALLTLLAYTRYAQGGTRDLCQGTRTDTTLSPATRHPSRFYWLALFFFALGLMSKPMLVTLPFVMLLLDYWPLRRIPDFEFRIPNLTRLVLGKWPFFLLAVVSCVVTFLVQCHGEAVLSLQRFPLNLRIENSLTAYAHYLLKTFWPVNLAVIYPLPREISWFAVAAAAAVLIFLSAAVWRARKRSPCLPVGWFWFLGTLVPVIGLVQVGGAALADRYTYFPLMGVFIAVAFGVRDLINRFRFPKIAVTVAAVLILAGCVVLTENQLRYWHDSKSLFIRSLAVTKDNDSAHLNLGAIFHDEGRLDEALAEYREAARLSPGYFSVHNSLGSVLAAMSRPEEALAEYRLALRLKPNVPALHNGTGIVLVELGRFDEAMNEFAEAARLDPGYPWSYFQMGRTLLGQGRDAGAIDEFRTALRIDPNNFQILAYVTCVLAADEKPEVRDGQTALMYAARANVLSDGTQPYVLDALGMACAETGDFTNAQEVAQRALDLATAAKMKKLEPLQQRLELYKNHQPWRESFLFTNTPGKH